MMVIWWSIFSGPRRSNFPKSFDPGTIESPAHFDCIMITRITMMATRVISIWRMFICMKKWNFRKHYIKRLDFCKFLDFFHDCAIMKQNYFSMDFLFLFLRRLFLVSLSFLLLLSGAFSVRAGDPSTDLTSPWFKIDTKLLDPVKSERRDTGTDTNPWNQSPSPSAEADSLGVLNTLLKKIAELLLFIMPVIAVISLIFAGYFYILSSGDSEKATKAKTIIKWNIVAILVALFSYVIINMIASLLGGS